MKVFILCQQTFIRDVEKTDIISVFKEFKKASDAHELIRPEKRYQFYIDEREIE